MFQSRLLIVLAHMSLTFLQGIYGDETDGYSILGFKKPSDKWDALRVTWGPNLQGDNVFVRLPRTESAAQSDGFTMLSDCGDIVHFAGKRYVKDGDFALILLYDINGYIAGIQAGIPDPQPNGYPHDPLRHHPFVPYGDIHYITAYFVPPNQICSVGRTAAMFERDGTGNDLYIQNGTSYCQVEKIPQREDDLTNTQWVGEKCFPSMGVHYWYNTLKDMSCEEFFPVFLLYNNRKLNAFGWAFQGNLSSFRFEHPMKQFLSMFLQPVPDCLSEGEGILSTMHIFLTDDIMLNRC